MQCGRGNVDDVILGQQAGGKGRQDGGEWDAAAGLCPQDDHLAGARQGSGERRQMGRGGVFV